MQLFQELKRESLVVITIIARVCGLVLGSLSWSAVIITHPWNSFDTNEGAHVVYEIAIAYIIYTPNVHSVRCACDEMHSASV